MQPPPTDGFPSIAGEYKITTPAPSGGLMMPRVYRCDKVEPGSLSKNNRGEGHMRCPYCGGLNQDRAVFCVSCGRDLKRAPANTQAPRPPAQAPQRPAQSASQPASPQAAGRPASAPAQRPVQTPAQTPRPTANRRQSNEAGPGAIAAAPIAP